MKTVTVAETKAHLSEILTLIEQGEEVTITRRGKPIVQMTSTSPPKQPLPSLTKHRLDLPQSTNTGTQALQALRNEQR
ncbi:MAG TPA: type II toxin-antitoxin system Phd/YefM family antitoxin [Gammaproteobacteria bacterium]|nr:type II toxin-antitoxin system Phd/YefM family antitoxin [Gammaproteobacteria bacterium]